VDQNGRVADEQACVSERRAAHPAGYFPMYRWYYYPYGGSPYPLGYGVPMGGSYAQDPFRGVPTRSIGVPSIGSTAPRAGAVRYGGFGSTAAGSAGE
ncbi:MAG TPA: hypothetical protein VM121_01550, partial [Acidimicrobiales bacterium]|nr:hypothetical protein [Acidimicrobiales bacterium]